MTFEEFCKLKCNDPMENIFPKGTEPDEAMDILETTFIGELTFAPYKDVIKAIVNKCGKRTIYNFDDMERLNAQEAVDLLRAELLPDNWYISYPCGYAQANTEIVGKILDTYLPKETKNPIVKFFKKLLNSLESFFH